MKHLFGRNHCFGMAEEVWKANAFYVSFLQLPNMLSCCFVNLGRVRRDGRKSSTLLITWLIMACVTVFAFTLHLITTVDKVVLIISHWQHNNTRQGHYSQGLLLHLPWCQIPNRPVWLVQIKYLNSPLKPQTSLQRKSSAHAFTSVGAKKESIENKSVV